LRRLTGKTGQALQQRPGRRRERICGHNFDTAVRERLLIMSILLNNFSIELKVMPMSNEKYRSTASPAAMASR
jgi:hypothetical protein